MSPTLSLVISAVAASLSGSIPFSLLVARWVKGIDLRQHGSGNVGATNVARTVGAKWGIVATLLDALKGTLPVLILPLLLPVPAELTVHQKVLCAACAILGHMFSPWLNFKGGKGVATGLGVAAVLAPWATLIAFTIFAITFGTSRIVSLASILAALGFAVTELAMGGAQLWSAQNWSLGLFSVGIPLLILIRHRSNIIRLLTGKENALSLKSSQADQATSPEQKSEASKTETTEG